MERLSTKQLFLDNIDYAADLVLIYVVTLSIFPGFLYENTGTHQLGTWYVPILFCHFILYTTVKLILIPSFYVGNGDLCRYPIVLIAMYNVVDFIARYIPLVPWLKLESRKGLMIATLSRFLLVPAFYFTAKYGDQGWMIFLASFLGLTNGYLTVCVMTVAPRGYKASLYFPQLIKC